MLTGEVIRLRPVRAADLEHLYAFHIDVANRGEFFPVKIASEPGFRDAFNTSGFWSATEGMLLIVDESDAILGHIEFYQTLKYLDELELSYQLYSREHDGRGAVTDAVRLMSGYLFDNYKYNRIRLIIHPDNHASQRIAEKCGFTHEGIARGAWFHRGHSQDVEVYALLREEYYEQVNHAR
jgi:[ribosomal protein S5]-alanine N-acetyltransferase